MKMKTALAPGEFLGLAKSTRGCLARPPHCFLAQTDIFLALRLVNARKMPIRSETTRTAVPSVPGEAVVASGDVVSSDIARLRRCRQARRDTAKFQLRASDSRISPNLKFCRGSPRLRQRRVRGGTRRLTAKQPSELRSEEHTSEL